VITTAANVTKNYSLTKLLDSLQKEQAAKRIDDLRGRVGDLRVGKATLLPSLFTPLVRVPAGSSLSVWEYYDLLGVIGGNTQVTRLLYRASVHGTTYDDLLRCLGDKTGLAFIIRKPPYKFGAFISGGIQLPDGPTDRHNYDCDVWYFSLAGHFDKPMKIDIPRGSQFVQVAGREASTPGGARVWVGGQLHLGLGDSIGCGPPAADIRCGQLFMVGWLPAGYTGERKAWAPGRGAPQAALLGGRYFFHADEVEVLQVGGA